MLAYANHSDEADAFYRAEAERESRDNAGNLATQRQARFYSLKCCTRCGMIRGFDAGPCTHCKKGVAS